MAGIARVDATDKEDVKYLIGLLNLRTPQKFFQSSNNITRINESNQQPSFLLRNCFNMLTLREVKETIQRDPANWLIHLMDFVDDFRYYKDPKVLTDSFQISDDRFDAILASTSQYLCDELGITPPLWILKIPACKRPWFVSELENLKAIALVESPVQFRIRKIFVLENFLSRA